MIVEGEWFDIKHSLSTYDGVLYDTYGEDDWSLFGKNIDSLVKSGAKVTWWNNNPSATTIQDIDGVTYDIIDVDPPSNSYFNSNKYYLPKKEF
jgi:hypothetical protein